MKIENMFTEKTLGEEIIKTWGEFGAHYEVFKMMLDRIESMENDIMKDGEHLTLMNQENIKLKSKCNCPFNGHIMECNNCDLNKEL